MEIPHEALHLLKSKTDRYFKIMRRQISTLICPILDSDAGMSISTIIVVAVPLPIVDFTFGSIKNYDSMLRL